MVIPFQVSNYFPVGCRKYCMTYNATRCVRPFDIAKDVKEPVVMVIGVYISYCTLYINE